MHAAEAAHVGSVVERWAHGAVLAATAGDPSDCQWAHVQGSGMGGSIPATGRASRELKGDGWLV